MAFSASRLTLFALLSAMEEDLRTLIETELGPQLAPEALCDKALWETIVRRCSNEVDPSDAALPELLVYADFGDLIKLLNAHRERLPKHIAAYVRGNTDKFNQLIPIRNRVAHTRPLNFDDLPTVIDHAKEFTRQDTVPWSSLCSTQSRLRDDPSFVLNLLIPNYESTRASRDNLPVPDFDETGFIGRSSQIEHLTKLCLGPYPVISILGEGGLGKTALALKVAYEILDLPKSPFDAVVWTSSKTTQLTAQEIVRIRGSITDSLGMFRNVAEHLGPGAEDPMTEVLQYLAEFKILLIIDNLETILDERVRRFLSELPQGSKVLITSRIGVGAFEYPVKLSALSDSEAVQLLRALARARQTEQLVKMPNEKLTAFCGKMHNNPAYLKWFVAAVQAGKRPEEALANPDIFLDYCMSNVYEYLGEMSKDVLKCMLCVPGRNSQAKLAFLSEMDVRTLQPALQQLLASNMVSMASQASGSSYESQYEVSELARSYLLKHHTATPDAARRVTNRLYELKKTSETMKREQTRNPYSARTIQMRSESDLIVAKYLAEALVNERSPEYAEELIERARRLAPEFYEVYRVDAWIKASNGQIPAAEAAYAAAVELEPVSAPLRYFWGGFLLRYADLARAIEQLREAIRLDPESSEALLELARALLYSQEFEECRQRLDSLFCDADVTEWFSRKRYGLHLEYHARFANHHLEGHNYEAAAAQLVALRKAYEECPEYVWDSRMRKPLARSLRAARSCLRHLSSDDTIKQITALVAWLEEEAAKSPGVPPVRPNESRVGTVNRINRDKGYAYVETIDNREVRIDERRLAEAEWAALQTGMKVRFETQQFGNSIFAVKIRPADG